MLKTLGYDTKSEKPDYGKPDQKILDNTFNIKANPEKWNELKKNYLNFLMKLLIFNFFYIQYQKEHV
jgi:hypothetical protein